MNIRVKKVNSEKDLESVFSIREIVFVQEQQVAREEEKDEFENLSTHFLATIHGKPVGTARWRRTNKGIKLERFAVLQENRRTGVGQALVKAVLEDIEANYKSTDSIAYLNAQLSAITLYAKFGFKQDGELFMECGIPHYSMKKNI